MSSNDDAGTRTLKIHRSTVLGADSPHVMLTVHCPVVDRAVPTPRCEACASCVSFPDGPARTDATITCRVVVRPEGEERAPDGRKRAGVTGRVRADLGESAARAPIHEVMESVYSVTARAPLAQVVALFESPAVAMVPVTSVDGAPVGVISRANLIRERWALTRADLTAEDLMTPLAYTLPDVASLSHAITLMALEGIHAVPIVDADGIVVGLVTAVGAMRWIAERMGYLMPLNR